ncbi:hypothetical protein EHQ86_10920 [Leptospira yasudae]|nr:hypothetical protein EHQ86_10920 [Leptospira yasudae]
MQKLNLIIGFCFCFVSCLYSVKPNYTIERFESARRPQAEIGYVSFGNRSFKETLKKDFGRFIEVTEYSEKERDKIRIAIQEYSYRDEDKNTFGKIGIFNFCILIPCWKTYDSGVRINYDVNGETQKEEIYTENKKLWVWLPLVMYNIVTFSSENEDYDKTEYLNLLNNISPNIAKSTLEIENKIKPKVAEHLLEKQRELSEWERVNKKSLRNIVHFLQKVRDKEIEKQAEEFLNNLLDKKIQTHLANRFPFIKPYLKNILLHPNGDPAGETQFFQIFTRLVLEKDSETGFKQDVKLFQKNGKIIWEISYDGETNLLYFLPYKNNITLEKISRKSDLIEVTLDTNFEQRGVGNKGEGLFRAARLYGRFIPYPLWKDLDVDFLDSTK